MVSRDGNGREHDERRLRGHPEARLPVGSGRRDRHDQRRDEQRPRSPPASPHHDPAGDGCDEQRVVRDQPEGGDPSLAPLSLVVADHVPRAVQAPGASDARERDEHGALLVVPDVVERAIPEDLAVDRLVAPRVRAEALQVGEPFTVAEVHGVAVRAEQGDAVVRRQVGRLVEAGQVVADPGRYEDGSR